jgi:hypothetical protein
VTRPRGSLAAKPIASQEASGFVDPAAAAGSDCGVTQERFPSGDQLNQSVLGSPFIGVRAPWASSGF